MLRARAGNADQLAMPGTSFAPPVAAMDPSWLEAAETHKKRRAAARLASVLEDKDARFKGRKPGGGTTNREKARLKNFMMLRKSSGVQGKLKASLKTQHNDIKRRLQGSAGTKLRKVSKKTANRRRRT